VSVVCCQVEVSATSWSLVQRSHTYCGASSCVIQKPRECGGPGPLGGCRAKNKQTIYCILVDWMKGGGEGREDLFCSIFPFCTCIFLTDDGQTNDRDM